MRSYVAQPLWAAFVYGDCIRPPAFQNLDVFRPVPSCTLSEAGTGARTLAVGLFKILFSHFALDILPW